MADIHIEREHLLIEYVIHIPERLRLILLILHAFLACKSSLWLLNPRITGPQPGPNAQPWRSFAATGALCDRFVAGPGRHFQRAARTLIR